MKTSEEIRSEIPKNLIEFADEYAKNNQPVDLVEFYRDARSFQIKWEFNHSYCAVCDIPLTEETNAVKDEDTFHEFLCEKHLEYKNFFNTRSIRRKLGFPEHRNIPNFYGRCRHSYPEGDETESRKCVYCGFEPEESK